MTAIILDGFAHYGSGATGTANMLAGPWASIFGSNTLAVPAWDTSGELALQYNGVNPSEVRRVLPTPGTHFFLSFRFAVDSVNSSSTGTQFALVEFRDGSNNMLFYLSYTSTGALALHKAPRPVAFNQDGPTVAQTAGPVIVAENFHFLEMEVNTSAHTFTLRVDDADASGTPVLNVTDTSIAGTIAQIAVLSLPGAGVDNAGTHLKDLFIRDANGTVNNSWLGDRRIGTLFMDADTTTSGWAPSYYKEFGTGIYSSNGGFLTAASATALDPGASDFTIEGFFRFQTLPTGSNYSTLLSRWDSSVNHRSWRLVYGGSTFNSNCLEFDISTDGTTSTQMIAYPWQPTTDTWYHIALVRASGELLLFINGNQVGLPIADSNTYFSGGAEVLGFGAEVQGTGTAVSGSTFAGWADEIRFTNGVARYTSSFTEPTSAFPRGSGSDPDWSSVALLMGFDGSLSDESGFARVITSHSGATFFLPTDGPLVGAYSTVNKIVPDDNTFISASLSYATDILTMTTQPSNGDTVTVGTTDGTTAAVYTFKTAISVAFDVLIDTTAQGTLTNLLNAINAGAGGGTKYGAGTTANFDVNGTSLPAGQIEVTANIAGSGGNSIAATKTGTAASWATATLTGGAGIPGPTQFKFQRPNVKTTIISAVQLTPRAYKTDSGTASIQSSLVGALGGLQSGVVHPLTINAVYYGDVVEKDPDTLGAITPTTLINGRFQINRTA